MSNMSKKPLTTLLMSILVLLVAVIGITAFALNGASDDWRMTPAASDFDNPANVIDNDQQQKSEQAYMTGDQPQLDAVSSATLLPITQETTPDVISSATQVLTGQATIIDTVASATRGQTWSSEAPDVISSATVRSDDDEDEEHSDDGDEDENDDDDDDRDEGIAVGRLISIDQAKAIALARVGKEARILSIELESDDYPPIYEIELKADNQTIELKIHAITGALLEHDRKSDGSHDEEDDEDDEDDAEEDEEDDEDDN